MLRAVFDTNVLASGFVGFERPASTPGKLMRLWAQGSFELVVSEPILTEVTRTLEDRYFAKRLSVEQRERDLALLRQEATLSPLTREVSGVATHPEDDLVLATAISANATHLVTGDRGLQALGDYLGVTISSPRVFLEILSRGGGR